MEYTNKSEAVCECCGKKLDFSCRSKGSWQWKKKFPIMINGRYTSRVKYFCGYNCMNKYEKDRKEGKDGM